MLLSIIFIVALFVAVTYLFGFLYKLAESLNRKYMIRSVGWTGFTILGFIGVPFHELAHLIMAVVFRYKITGVALYRPVAGRQDGVLGYVRYSERGKWYEKLGRFFVGTAPMVFGAVLMFILIRVFFPQAFVEVTEIPDSLESLQASLREVFTGFYSAFSVSGVLGYPLLIVCITGLLICPHLGMSGADFKGTLSGTAFLLVAGVIIPLFMQFLPWFTFNQIYAGMSVFLIYYVYALLVGLAISLLSGIFYWLLAVLLRR